jgi:hypothetical protein
VRKFGEKLKPVAFVKIFPWLIILK